MLFSFVLLASVFFGGVTHAANPILFCKCFCGSNSTIFELPMIEKPCGNCTKQFCLDNVKDGICDGIVDETCPSNDFKTACFARDSFKDEFIVRIFLITVFSLMLYALVMPFYNNWTQKQKRRKQYDPVVDQDPST